MKGMQINPLLIKKYDQPVPRYTSYPTVPFWDPVIDTEKWKYSFADQFDKRNHTEGLSLYIHLPFCESLCTYCGCNKKITTNHSVEEVYIDAISKEWKMYRKLMSQTPVIRQLHLGGGTPTFFSLLNLKKLIGLLLKDCITHPLYEFSIEGHPNNTTADHLKVLAGFGFRRISYGVQDLDPEVQRVINRIQPFENVARATEEARQAGFNSVNFDLIYGLPKQNLSSITNTIEQVIGLKPDRIAFYSYAHVPWTSRGQRLFDENDLPAPEEKLALYVRGKQLLTDAGYIDIGMDHFALPNDDLYKAYQSKTLHRNFMGYAAGDPGLLLGLGVSAISDIGVAYAQNVKTLKEYYRMLEEGELPSVKGYFLNEEDLAVKQYILDISCRNETVIQEKHHELFEEFTKPLLQKFSEEGLLVMNGASIRLTDAGHHFIRNICSAFDLRLQRKGKAGEAMFSKAI